MRNTLRAKCLGLGLASAALTGQHVEAADPPPHPWSMAPVDVASRIEPSPEIRRSQRKSALVEILGRYGLSEVIVSEDIQFIDSLIVTHDGECASEFLITSTGRNETTAHHALTSTVEDRSDSVIYLGDGMHDGTFIHGDVDAPGEHPSSYVMDSPHGTANHMANRTEEVCKMLAHHREVAGAN